MNGEGEGKFNPNGRLKISEAIKLSSLIHRNAFNVFGKMKVSQKVSKKLAAQMA